MCTLSHSHSFYSETKESTTINKQYTPLKTNFVGRREKAPAALFFMALRKSNCSRACLCSLVIYPKLWNLTRWLYAFILAYLWINWLFVLQVTSWLSRTKQIPNVKTLGSPNQDDVLPEALYFKTFRSIPLLFSIWTCVSNDGLCSTYTAEWPTSSCSVFDTGLCNVSALGKKNYLVIENSISLELRNSKK